MVTKKEKSHRKGGYRKEEEACACSVSERTEQRPLWALKGLQPTEALWLSEQVPVLLLRIPHVSSALSAMTASSLKFP